MSNSVTQNYHSISQIIQGKSSISILFFVYCFSILAQIVIALSPSHTYAATNTNLNRLIAVLVDTKLYESHQTQIDRYASTYLQKQYSDSKALITPIISANFQAQDIHKILQNLYFEGEENNPSELIGVVLLGDIPLPVVNDNDFIYTSIYPYVDFIKPQFIYSQDANQFITNPGGTKQDPEIRHNFIRFDTTAEYTSFFLKLSQYAQNPGAWVSNKVWVDDLVQEQKSYDQAAVINYANQFVFAEDLARQRYTNLLADLTNTQAGEKAQTLFSSVGKNRINATNVTSDVSDLTNDLAIEQAQTANSINGYFEWVDGLGKTLKSEKSTEKGTFSTDAVGTLQSTHSVPTLFLQQILDGYLYDYHQLYSEEYHTTVNNLIEPSGRYQNNGTNIGTNSHIWKTYQHDELTKTIITNLNDQLEKVIDTFNENEKVYMTVPIPTTRLEYRNGVEDTKGSKTRNMILDHVVDVSYFGSDPASSDNIQDMMIFRGTFNNLTGISSLSGYNYISKSPLITADNSVKSNASIGSTYGFQSREVEANRGYNVMLAESDQELREELPKIILAGVNECSANRVAGKNANQLYIDRYWGGYTPLNINTDNISQNGDLKLNTGNLDHTRIWSPSYAIAGATFGGTVYDIAGSKILHQSRKLNVVAGMTEWEIKHTIDANWTEPEDCDAQMNEYIQLNQEKERLMRTDDLCINSNNAEEVQDENGSMISCDYVSERLNELQGSLQKFEQDNQGLIEICEPHYIETPVELIPKMKQDIALSGVSDNYKTYTTFAAVQQTTYRKGITTKARFTSASVDNYVRRYKGLEGVPYAVSKAVQQQSIKPVLYCNKEDNWRNDNNQKNIYTFDVVDFFKVIKTAPTDGMKIRVMINPSTSALNLKPLTTGELLQDEQCENILLKMDELTEQYHAESSGKNYVTKVLLLTQYNQSKIKLETDNKICFEDKEKIHHYEASNAVGKNDKRGYRKMLDYFYQTTPSLYIHKAPTADDLYGKELKVLKGIQRNYAYPDTSKIRKKGKKKEQYNIAYYQYNGLKLEVDSISFVLEGGDYQIAGNKVYFNSGASLNLYGKDIDLSKFMGTLSGSMIYLTGSDKLSIEERILVKYPRYGGMNMGTSDRPIDSVRYTSFQGIGGDLVKVVYPNLYNVPVFSGGKLKSEEEIKIAIKAYLILQARQYCAQLENQQTKSQAFYNTEKKAFDVLTKADKLASPVNRPGYDISKITDDFFVKGLSITIGNKKFSSEDIITILARNLYYQNLITPIKESSPILNTELNNLYKQVSVDNINSKRKFIFDTYLTHGSDKTTGGTARLQDWAGLSGQLIPSYDNKGYEITAITSNGSDYHVDPNLNPTLQQFQIVSDKTAITPRQEDNKSTTTSLVCGGKTYVGNVVPLLQYPQAFKCWLEDIKTNSIKFNINGDLIGLLTGGKLFSSFTGYTNSYLEGRKKFGSDVVDIPHERTSLLESATQVLSKSGLDLGSAQFQKWRAELETKKGWSRLSQSNKATLDKQAQHNITAILNSIGFERPTGNQIKVGGTGQIIISTTTKTQTPFNIEISGTGSACITLNGTNTCTTSINLTNLGTKAETIRYTLGTAQGAKLGDAGLLLNICTTQGTTACLQYPIIYQIIPGDLATIEIIDPLNGGYLARGSQMPFIVIGKDNQGRAITHTKEPYTVVVDSGNLIYMTQESKTIDIHTRDNFTTIYDSSNIINTSNVDNIIIKPLFLGDALLPIKNYQIPLADPILKIATREGNQNTSQGISFKLPSKPNTLTQTIAGGETTMIPDKIPVIRLGLEQFQGKSVTAMVQITSQNGLVTPGSIGSTKSGNITQYIWSDQDTFIITGGMQDIYLFPSYRAGSDTILVKIGNKTRSIPLKILAGDPAGTTITAPEALKLNQTGIVQIQVTDYRGNNLETNTWIDLQAYGRLFTLVNTNNAIVSHNTGGLINGIQTTKGTAKLSLVPKAIIGKGYITTQVRGIALDQQRSSYAGTLVQSILRPTKNINSLVLELKGKDRGGLNQDTTTKASKLITQSHKLLSVVTNLSDSNTLRKSQLILYPQGGLGGNFSKESRLTLTQGSWTITTDTIGAIQIDPATPYNIIKGSSTALTTTPNLNQSTVIYIPNTLDSTITQNDVNQNTIFINNQAVLNHKIGTISPDIRILYIQNTPYGAGIFDVMYRGKQVGQMILYRGINTNSLTTYREIITNQLIDAYTTQTGYVGASTNSAIGLHIIEQTSRYEITTKESDGDYLIAQFGQGLSVGNATKGYDQFSITYGDAALSKSTINTPAFALVSDNNKRITQNLPYDTGIGQLIYNNPDKPINKVVSIDFNNDKLKDLIVVYTDGSVRLLKNYGGDEPFTDMGHLMIIADGIQDIYVGDVDKNGFEDIIVHTQEGKLRVYFNSNGKFDVDGYPVCLSIPGGPDDISDLYYRTIRDMDKDGGIDILTYDKNGDVKIFYGGSNGSKKGASYVSNQLGTCDNEREKRQQSTLVQSFGMNLLSTPIRDDSLIHWSTHVIQKNPYTPTTTTTKNASIPTSFTALEALENTTTPTLTDPTQIAGAGVKKTNFEDSVPKSKDDYKPDTFAKTTANLATRESIDLSAMTNATYTNISRYVPVSDNLKPSYTPTTQQNLYLPINQGITADTFNASKTFKDLNGGVLIDRDLVEVTVEIKGTSGVAFSYLEKLTGPWLVPLNQKGILEGVSSDFIKYKDSITFNIDGYLFRVNGAIMNPDGVIRFSYIVQYSHEKLVTIEVKDSANYPIIDALSLDGCQKTQWQFTSKGGTQSRSYNSKIIDHTLTTIKSQNDTYKKHTDATEKIIEDIVTSVGKEDGIFDYVKERRNNDNTFQRAVGIIDGTYLQSIPLQLRIGLQSGSKEQEISRKISEFTNKLCNGFKPGTTSCAGVTPPVGLPTNIAIPPLTPGVVHIMGYKVFNDKGLPLLAFPIKSTPFIRPPNPDGAGGWLGGKTSQFRFYATPTTTAGMGFAFCFGPYDTGIKFPSPFKNIAGNCIVAGVKPKARNQTACLVESDPDYTPPAQIQIPSCFGSLTTDISKSSPLQMVLIDESAQQRMDEQRTQSPSDTYNTNDPQWKQFGTNNGVQKAIQRFDGTIKVPKSAQVVESHELFCIGQCGSEQTIDTYINEGLETTIANITEYGLKGGVKQTVQSANIRKVGRGIMNGIGACVMQIVDNQVQYIKNNLLTMNMNVIFPDLTTLGFSKQRTNEKIRQDGSTLTQNTKSTFTGNINSHLSQLVGESVMKTGANNSLIDGMSTTMDAVEINPFYAIEQLFNDIELIRISQQDIMLDIPFATVNQLQTAKIRLEARRERNKGISQQRIQYGKDLAKECTQLSDPNKKKECEELVAQVVQINKQFGQLERSYHLNVGIINQYMNFFNVQLPNWKEQHITYLVELTSVVQSTMDQIAKWASTNSNRFTARTSSIRSTIAAMKTRQLLIDFSTNRKGKCGTCKIDNNDFATCSLNGLCPNFNLINRPKVRTPDITIDLSNIEGAVDVVIPNIRLRPVNLPLARLLELPNLPLPPQLGSPFYAQLNIIVPTLPQLPTLPSLSMSVEMDLPTLPPAPKIPALPETLNAIVKVADFIGDILCIVKGDFGLVGEKFVKQKIEQITQRTRNVSPFDTIRPIASRPRIQGHDIKLNAYVNLRFYFDQLYDIFDDFGTQRNLQMGELSNQMVKGSLQASDWVRETIVPGAGDIGKLGDWTPEPIRFDATIQPLSVEEFDIRMTAALKQFERQVTDTKLGDTARELAGLIQKPINANTNIQGITDINNTAQQTLQKEIGQAKEDLMLLTTNYDQWLETMTNDQYVSDTNTSLTLSTNLYTINPEVQTVIETSDIAKDYLKGNQILLQSYNTVLNNRTSQDLGISPEDHVNASQYVTTMLNNVEHILAFEEQVKDDINTTLEPDTGDPSSNTTNSQNTTNTPTSTPAQQQTVGFDQSTQRDGYLIETIVQTPSGNLVKAAVDVIKPEGLGTKYRQTSFKTDMNGNNPNTPDIVLRDDYTIYIKYSQQNDQYGAHTTSTTVYRLPTLISPSDLAAITNNTNGYVYYNGGLLSRSQGFKVRSHNYAITNFTLKGQTYDSAIFEWINPERIGQGTDEIYIARLHDIVDTFKDKKNHTPQYILFIPQGMIIDPLITKITIPGQNTQTIKTLLDRKIIHDIVNTDINNETITGLLRNLTRKWYYAQAARMELQNNTFSMTSPWSNQDVAGYQISADTVAPTPTVELIRTSTKEQVGGGVSLQGFINTHYELKVTWKDNVGLARSSLPSTTTKGGERIITTKIYEQKPKTLIYNFDAKDSSNNITKLQVTVTIQNPQLETTNANNTNDNRGTITSKLTPDLDDGIIKFQAQGAQQWSTLIASPSGLSGYLVKPGQTTFTGGLYQFPNSWGLNDANGNSQGSIGSQGQIITSTLQLLVSFTKGYPTINFVNTSGVTLYEATYAPITLTGSNPIQIKEPSQYRTLSLENFNMAIAGDFAGGTCIAPQLGECEVYISKIGDIWVDPSVRTNYHGTYEWKNGHSIYHIIRDQTYVAQINLITKPLQ